MSIGHYTDASKLPRIIPIFPLYGALLLPRGQLPLNIFEPRYLQMFEDSLAGGRMIGMVQPMHKESDPISDTAKLFSVGCIGKIVEFRELEDGRIFINLQGISRFRTVRELPIERGYRRIQAEFTDFISTDLLPQEASIDREGLLTALRQFLSATVDGTGERIDVNWAALNQADDEDLVNALAMLGPFEAREKQALLESPNLESRCELLATIMSMAALEEEGGSTRNH